MRTHPDYASIKTLITATLDRLNAHGVIASVSDATIAFHRAREAKVAEAFRGVFNDMSLEKLAVADAVLTEMFPRPAPLASATITQPPATVAKSAKAKRK